MQRGVQVQNFLRAVEPQPEDFVCYEVDFVFSGQLCLGQRTLRYRCLRLLHGAEKVLEPLHTRACSTSKCFRLCLFCSIFGHLHDQLLLHGLTFFCVSGTPTDSGRAWRRRQHLIRNFSLLRLLILALQFTHLGLCLRGHVGFDPLKRFLCALRGHAIKELSFHGADCFVPRRKRAYFCGELFRVLERLAAQGGVGNDVLERVDRAFEPREVRLRILSRGHAFLALLDGTGLEQVQHLALVFRRRRVVQNQCVGGRVFFDE